MKHIEASRELKKTRAELEQKVEERTAESVKANDRLKREIKERKRAEQALRESEERYQTLTEHVADGVTLVQNGKFLFVNNAFVSMFGHTNANQILGKRAVDLISCGFDQGIKEIYGKLESGLSGEKIFRAQCITREGRKFWVKVHHNIIKWKGMSAVLTTIKDITETRLREIVITERLRNENIRLRSSIKERYRFGDIIGKSQPMQEIYELILKAANSDANVVISGESGTGKEMVARAIHDMSNRRDKVFVAVNCGAIPETLLESEFFGYKKGAFTGANMDKHGYLDLAGGGTLFLDEVSELDLSLQVKLLRVIDGGGYTPVGSNKAKYSDFRIIAATNKNLLEQVNKNLMREDFFYRMHVIPVTVPPLRERKEDVPLLVEHFLKLHCDSKERQSLPVKIFEAIDNHDWPGNVRELENVLKRYITIQSLDFINPRGSRAANEVNDSNKELLQENAGLRDAVELFEKDYISKVLNHNKWHRGKTAKTLGIPERTLYRKLKHFNLGLS
ncbi:MAG: sigma 54-interacting transcriptional regulator [Desulfobacteraceae bacterium]|nr:sigma 54-interacting transcriptional regulator [Desulfobacteraceae bacterium]MBC2718752.1 sigma 54-interacting transcriptional regulator [Desulfobacteraceae bacterium]